MPSPISHMAMGYAIYKLYHTASSPRPEKRHGSLPCLLIVTVWLSLLPDLDIIPGILSGNVNHFHNNISHSLFFGLLVALGVSGLVWLRQRMQFMYWFLLVLWCYELHVIMDLFTIGRGVMIFWPFSPERYEPAVMLFYGLRRSEGLVSIHHAWTLITELGFVLLVGFMAHVLNGVKEND